jgi:formamidopyrimidine-DNA glycosylase
VPELPEVEVLARHLRPVLLGKTILDVEVRRAKVIRPTEERALKRVLTGAKFSGLSRRGKYLLFDLRSPAPGRNVTVLGHLGMSGRMFVARRGTAWPKHAAVVLKLTGGDFIYEDTRYFGRFTLDLTPVAELGPEPLDDSFPLDDFARNLKRSRQPVKVKLLDQSLIAGVGNIYASEALFRAGISPKRAASQLSKPQAGILHQSIRAVLTEAIDCGSTVPLNFGTGKTDGLFYFGRAAGAPDYYEERLQVYDRAGKPCLRCGSPIRRLVQAARSTFYCPRCQKS